jgi:FkbM family methyltransferase
LPAQRFALRDGVLRVKFVSFAQNFEDVMLWRALKHVQNGFYVDVGAQDPDADSVSRAFYDRGWSGINVEPVPFYAARLSEARPRDVNLRCVVSDTPGSQPLYVFDGTGLSTLSLEQANRNRRKLGIEFRTEPTASRTLRDIFDEFRPEAVHWLKIDVEGAEPDVLRSWNGSSILPWIIVVEATLPNEATEAHSSWQPILTDVGYVPAYFDGLNRFYVSGRHPELLPAFRTPPNVFDDFTLAAVERVATDFRRAEEFAKTLEVERTACQAYADDLKASLAKSEAYSATLESASQTLHAELEALNGYAAAKEEAAVVFVKDLERTLAKCRLDLAALNNHLAAKEDAYRQEVGDLRRSYETAVVYAKDLERAVEENRHELTALHARLAANEAVHHHDVEDRRPSHDATAAQVQDPGRPIEPPLREANAVRGEITTQAETRRLEVEEPTNSRGTTE